MATILHDSTTAQGRTSLGRRVDWSWILLLLWVVSTALFFARAIAGYFPHPLPSLALIAVGVVAVIIAMELRVLLRGSYQASVTIPHSPTQWFAQLFPTLGVLLLAIGFSVAGAYATGLVLLWVLIAGETLFGAAGPWTLPLVRRLLKFDQPDLGTTVLDHPRATLKEKARAEPVALVPEAKLFAEPVSPVKAPELEAEEEPELNDELPWLWQDATALQELRYMTLPESGLCIAGSQRATLSAAQQIAVVHTVFHPPFDAVPTVTIEMQEPDFVVIKAAQILPHGIRWELRAAQPLEEPQQVQWAFTAMTAKDPRG